MMRKFIVALVCLSILEISLSLYLTYWRQEFWQAVSDKQVANFLLQLGIFTIVALCIGALSGASGYLISLATIEWRKRLNKRALAVLDSQIENMPQRIQSDAGDYPALLLSLVFGLGKSMVYIVVFSIALALSFPWAYLGILLCYTAIGTVVTSFIAKPLIKLNYEQQRVEATYRNDLTLDNFTDCIIIMLGLAKKQKHLTYFQQFYGQIGVVIPLIIVAPQYFTTGMSLGVLMRFNSTAGSILDHLSYGIISFGEINKLLSCHKRLREAGIL